MIQACFFATEKTAAVGFNAIKQGKRDLLLSFFLFTEDISHTTKIIERKQNTSVVITLTLPGTCSLGARWTGRGERVLLCRRYQMPQTQVTILLHIKLFFQGKVAADAAQAKRSSGGCAESVEMAVERFRGSVCARRDLPPARPVWEEPPRLAQGEKDSPEMQFGETELLVLSSLLLFGNLIGGKSIKTISPMLRWSLFYSLFFDLIQFLFKVDQAIESLKNRITSSLQNCFDSDDIKVLVKVD